MKHPILLAAIAACTLLSLAACQQEPAKQAAVAPAPAQPAKPDMAKIKTEIQALETAWSTADNARDAAALTAFYADDAVSLSNNMPMLVGKAAIQKDIEASMAKRVKGSTVAYDVLSVFGDGETVTEIGTTTRKDATGKVDYKGKYMAIWQMRNGKYLCVADIANDDVKAK